MVIIKYNRRDEASEPLKCGVQSRGLCYLQHILCFNPHPDFPDMLQLQLMMYFQFGGGLI